MKDQVTNEQFEITAAEALRLVLDSEEMTKALLTRCCLAIAKEAQMGKRRAQVSLWYNPKEANKGIWLPDKVVLVVRERLKKLGFATNYQSNQQDIEISF